MRNIRNTKKSCEGGVRSSKRRLSMRLFSGLGVLAPAELSIHGSAEKLGALLIILQDRSNAVKGAFAKARGRHVWIDGLAFHRRLSAATRPNTQTGSKVNSKVEIKVDVKLDIDLQVGYDCTSRRKAPVTQ